MAAEPHVIWLEDCTTDRAPLIGGKAAGLGALMREQLAVPRGFAVTTAAYREHVERHGLASHIERLLAAEDAEGIRALFENAALTAQLQDEVLAAHEQLGGAGQPMAVRSSATAEDQADASFAGQQETYLWLISGQEVLRHVVRCWASLFTAQAIAYRKHRRVPVTDLAMGVVVQQMVPAEAAGVMMTIDPVLGDRSTIVIEAAYGLGAIVVNGEVMPDRFCIDKDMLAVRSRTLGSKNVAYRFDAAVAGCRLVPVPPAQQRAYCVTDQEVLELTRLGKRMEEVMGGPQDLEWAIGPERGIFLLQVRPETIWSQT
ncbi:MAG TPA: PEP/pyruvate-binding domain-containing protein [Chloroflexota bacterium]